jgi:NADH:ubiquinone oxidoreductase subunit 2 (subunit N)
VLALINSAISIVYYANIVWRMFAVDPVKRDRLAVPGPVNITMVLAIVGILALTVAFGVLLTTLNASANSLFGLLH